MDRTGLFAPSTADTLTAVGVFHRIYFHLTGLCTFSTMNTFVHIHMVAEYRYPIKYRVKCTKRANIFAKWAVDYDGKYNGHN